MKQKMVRTGICIFLVGVSILAYFYEPNTHKLLEHYQKYHDFASLEKLSKHLELGMSRPEVEKILGKADYSPADGIVYYGSHDGRLGLILEYCKIDPTKDFVEIKTNKLERIIIGEILE